MRHLESAINLVERTTAAFPDAILNLLKFTTFKNNGAAPEFGYDTIPELGELTQEWIDDEVDECWKRIWGEQLDPAYPYGFDFEIGNCAGAAVPLAGTGVIIQGNDPDPER
jgi:hypothetical protein